MIKGQMIGWLLKEKQRICCQSYNRGFVFTLSCWKIVCFGQTSAENLGASGQQPWDQLNWKANRA